MHDAHGGPKSADRARRLRSMSDLRHRIDIINGLFFGDFSRIFGLEIRKLDFSWKLSKSRGIGIAPATTIAHEPQAEGQ